MAQCQGTPQSNGKTFCWSSPVFGGKYCENPKVPGAQLNVNPAHAITWFVGVTIYCTFFNNNSHLPRQFSMQQNTFEKT